MSDTVYFMFLKLPSTEYLTWWVCPCLAVPDIVILANPRCLLISRGVISQKKSYRNIFLPTWPLFLDTLLWEDMWPFSKLPSYTSWGFWEETRNRKWPLYFGTSPAGLFHILPGSRPPTALPPSSSFAWQVKSARCQATCVQCCWHRGFIR